MRLRMLAIAGTAVIALVGCSHHPSNNEGADNRSTFFDAAKCMREHGYPDYPDPVRYDDRWGFPDSAPDVEPPEACRNLFFTGKDEQDPRPTVDAAYMTQARKFADCMRTHGLAGWPDPDSDGYFDPPAPLVAKTNDTFFNALDACSTQQPPGGWRRKRPS
jgi:hypothetical protein